MKILAKAAASCCALGLATAGFSAAAQPTAPQASQVGVREVWSTYGDPGWGEPRGMLQWPDGTVWVGDHQASEVWELSADGAESRRVLREGEGPGELRGVKWIVPYRDGGVVVMDARGFLSRAGTRPPATDSGRRFALPPAVRLRLQEMEDFWCPSTHRSESLATPT